MEQSEDTAEPLSRTVKVADDVVHPWCHFCYSNTIHKKAKLNQNFCTTPIETVMKAPLPSTCCQATTALQHNCAPSFHLILTHLFLPVTLVYLLFAISSTAARPLHPSIAGTGNGWLLLLPDILCFSFSAPGSCTPPVNIREHRGFWKQWRKEALPQHQESFSIF